MYNQKVVLLFTYPKPLSQYFRYMCIFVNIFTFYIYIGENMYIISYVAVGTHIIQQNNNIIFRIPNID